MWDLKQEEQYKMNWLWAASNVTLLSSLIQLFWVGRLQQSVQITFTDKLLLPTLINWIRLYKSVMFEAALS